MSLREMDRLIGTAMAEPRFCDTLLGSGRQEAIAAFDLTAEEQAVLLGIGACSLQGFAQVLHRWMSEKDGHEPVPPRTGRESLAYPGLGATMVPYLVRRRSEAIELT